MGFLSSALPVSVSFGKTQVEDGCGRVFRSARTGVPIGRMATGWEIAYAALFFISDESVYVNAQTLAVDSGITGL